GFLWYVMPYIKGESLREKLVREGELPIPEAVRILRDVVDALAKAHSEGVVHRDIKPDNVMLADRHALVTDFGVAKAVSEATGREKLTTAGVALGTPAYMAPEQAAAAPNIDHRADIYAIGALAYELLTGRPPFTGNTPQMILSAHVTQAPESVTKHRETVSPVLAQLVMRCLEKKPADRWQTAEEMLPHLEALTTPSSGMTPTNTRPVTAAHVPTTQPLRTYGVAAVLRGVALFGWWAVRGAGGGSSAIERIAVLPLENATGDSTQDFYAEGITHDIISVLTNMGVRIVGSRAVAKYRDTDLSPAEIANELNVDALVFGRLLAVSDRVRLTIELMEPQSQENLWSKTYDELAVDVMTLQNAIAREMAEQIQQEITPEQEARLAETRQVDQEAYAQLLLGRQQAQRWTEDGYRRALDHFNRAIARDSTLAAAYAEMGGAYEGLLFYGWIGVDSASALIDRAVNTALAIDNQLGVAYVTRAFQEWYIDWEFEAAERSFLRGLELAPHASKYSKYAWFLVNMGRIDSAIATVQKAIDLEPSTAQYHTDLGWWLAAAEQYELAVEAGRRATELDPTFWEAHSLLSWTYTIQGRYAEAEEEQNLSETLAGGVRTPWDWLQHVLFFAGANRPEETTAAYRQLEEVARHKDPPWFSTMAIGQFAMGNPDSALALLERAVDVRDRSVIGELTFNPLLYGLHDDPRFQALRERVGLPAVNQ
ncbi:MAG: protein kinase, partial [Gemmatimonadales bacterium]